MRVDTASELRFGVAQQALTCLAGLAELAGLVKHMGWAEALLRGVRLRQRRRGVAGDGAPDDSAVQSISQWACSIIPAGSRCAACATSPACCRKYGRSGSQTRPGSTLSSTTGAASG